MRATKLCKAWLPVVLASTAAFGAPKPAFHFVQCPGMPQTTLRGISNKNVAVGTCSDFTNPAQGSFSLMAS